MSKILLKEDYEILIQKQAQFESLINSQYLSYLDGPWVNEMGRIFKDYYNEPFKANCAACLKRAMTLLWDNMIQYKEQNKI